LPELSIVIPTFGRHEVLPRTLAALERQSVGPETFELVVVADAQEDDLPGLDAALAADSRAFDTRLLSSEVVGASAARNLGWRAARTPLVLFIGDDILTPPDFLEQHLAWHRRHPEDEVAVLGHVRWAREIRVSPFMRWLEDTGTQFDYGGVRGTEAGWTHFYTANVSIKRAMLERAGGFDEERFPFLYEDIDLGRRLADHGLRLLYNREAEGEHLHETTIADWRGRMAAVARSERRWVALHPELPAWFHDRFATAAGQRRVPATLGELASRIPRETPVVGQRAWDVANQYFQQQLAPAFLEAWAAEDRHLAS
jgi:GT2 family glycosyltransferase